MLLLGLLHNNALQVRPVVQLRRWQAVVTLVCGPSFESSLFFKRLVLHCRPLQINSELRTWTRMINSAQYLYCSSASSVSSIFSNDQSTQTFQFYRHLVAWLSCHVTWTGWFIFKVSVLSVFTLRAIKRLIYFSCVWFYTMDHKTCYHFVCISSPIINRFQ